MKSHHPARFRRGAAALASLAALALTLQAVGGATALTAHAASTSGQGSDTGVAVSGSELLYASSARRNADLDLVAKSGAHWLRVDVVADQIVNGDGSYNLSALDQIVSGAASRNLQVLGVLENVPSAFAPGTTPGTGAGTAQQRQAFTSFASTLAARYSTTVAAWEIWNEPNRSSSWAPAPSPWAYTQLLKSVYPAIKRVAPKADVVLGGTGGATASGDYSGQNWLQSLYDNGAQGYFDAAAMHAWISGPGIGEVANAPAERAVMNAHSDGSKELWLTQVGIPSGGSQTMSTTQAAGLVKSVTSAFQGTGYGPVMFYTLRDGSSDNAANRMGLVYQDGTPKPAYTALQQVSGSTVSAPAAVAPADPAPPVASPPAAAASTSVAQSTGVAVTGTSLLYVSDAVRSRDLDRIAATGGKWLRLDVAASQITWVNSSQYDWSRLDAVVSGARARGISVLGVLSGLPAYARPSGSSASLAPTTASQRAAFATFAQTVAKRYAGTVDSWEVWNEPNLVNYWAPSPNAYDYINLLSTTRQAIKAVNSSAVVVSGGSGGAGRSGDIDSITWLNQLYSAGLAGASDAVGVHLYTNYNNDNLGEFLRLDVYRNILDSHGDYNKPLWATEAGGSSGGPSRISESQGASFMTQAIARWNQLHNHGPMFIYTLYDDGGSDPNGYLGLYRTDGTAKPVLGAVQTATRG